MLDGLTLEVTLPGGKGAAPFLSDFQRDMTAGLRVMLGEQQYRDVMEQHRHPYTMRISQRAVIDFFRRLVEELSESLPLLIGAFEFEGALRASLRSEYGVDLRNPRMPLLDLADLVANLPRGCALWRATGGPLAWSDETHMLAAVRHGLDILAWQKTEDGSKGRNQPKPIEPPASVYDQREKEQRLSARAAAYLKRTGRS